jgi:hypothetical protein
VDQALIDRIVANVLEQLQPATPRAVMESGPVQKATAVALPHSVITADVLSAAVKPGQSVQFGTKSLLTPSAKDWLRQHQIAWRRGSTANSANETTSSSFRGQLLFSTVNATVRGAADSVFRTLPNWQRQISGSAKEVAESTTRAITTEECDRVLITSRDAELVACLANRHAVVRAAVATAADHVRRMEAVLSPNVIVVDPTERSFVELRNLFRACAMLGKPKDAQG